MANTMTITVPEEITEMMKDIKNKSGLISDLLGEYFNKTKKRTMEDMSLEEIRAEKEKLLSMRNDEGIRMLEELEKEKLETEEEKKLKIEEKAKKLSDNIKTWLKEFFIVEDSEMDSLVEMYNLEKKDYKNLYDWGISKGLLIKEKTN